MLGKSIEFNWDNLNGSRGDTSILKCWYEKDGITFSITEEFTNCFGEVLYKIGNIAGGFSIHELIICDPTVG